MTTDIATLLASKTETQLQAELLGILAANGFNVTAWQSGNAGRTLMKADARALASLYDAVATVTGGSFLRTATGGWLTLHAKSRFDLDRIPAIFGEGTVTLSVVSGAGPYTIAPGQLLVSDGTYRWRSTNSANVTVTSAAPVSIGVKAEATGPEYSAQAGGTITSVLSPAYAGLSVTNGSGWVTVTGAAEESDGSLRARCISRWATLGRGATIAAYLHYATNTPDAPTVVRAKVIPGPGDGTLTVVVAQSTATASSPQVDAVQKNIDANKPVTDLPTVVAAKEVTVTVSGTVKVRSASYNTAANRAKAQNAVAAYFANLGIGEVVDLGGIYAAIRSADGIVDVDLSSPTGDTLISDTQVAKCNYTIVSGDWSI